MKRAIEISARTIRWMLKLYPPSHLAEYGDAMAQLFRDLCRDGARRRGVAGLIAAWGFILWDLIGSLIREHRAEGRKAMTRNSNGTPLKGVAQSLPGVAATGVLVASVLKLTSLPLTEGQLVIGVLCACTASLQLVILGVLVTPSRVAPSQKQLEG